MTAVITGLGVQAPGGDGVAAFWERVSSGRPAIRRTTFFDPTPFRSQVAGECDFEPSDRLSLREARRCDRSVAFALVCAREALRDAGLDPDTVAPARLGVAMGSATGATTSLEREYRVLSDQGAEWAIDHRYAAPDLYGYMHPSTLAAEVAREVGAEGPVTLVSNGCTSGLDAVAQGARWIAAGRADVVVVGAADTPISPISVAAFDAIRATTPGREDPATSSRPFDGERNGFVLAEGGAVLVLESARHAAARGCSGYATIPGWGARANAHHMTGLRDDGRELAEAMRVALRRARVVPERVDYVNAHGSSTRQNDVHETSAVKEVLGAAAPTTPMSSIKAVVGHSMGAIGAIEIVACALAVRDDLVPPTANLDSPDPACDLDYVPNRPRHVPVRVAVSIGSGFGGFQSAVVLADPTVHPPEELGA